MTERPSPAERKLEEREIQQLRAPFTAEAIKFKLQTGGGTAQAPVKALMVPYIDARLVSQMARPGSACHRREMNSCR